MARRERLPEPVRPTVGVAVELEGRALDRLLRTGERPIGALVRGQLDDPLEPELALDLLHRLAGLIGDEPREGGSDQRRMTTPAGD